MEALERQSDVRKKEKRNIRNWKNYDPAKKAKLHSKYYNPTARAEKHKQNKIAEMENASKINEMEKRNVLNESRKSMEKDAREKRSSILSRGTV